MNPEDRISARIDTDASALGVLPPPVPVYLTFSRDAGDWTVAIRAICQRPLAELADWLDSAHAHVVELREDGTLRATFFARQSRWHAVLGGANSAFVAVDPSGKVVLDAEGARSEVAGLVRRLRALGATTRVRRVSAAKGAENILTGPQEHALRAAVLAGYYDIPRPLNLHDLAHELGISSASLSERLRRAEGRLIRRYVAGDLSAARLPNAPTMGAKTRHLPVTAPYNENAPDLPRPSDP